MPQPFNPEPENTEPADVPTAPLKAINRLAKPKAEQPLQVRYQPPLSVTERRVLLLLNRGMTEKQVAAELDRSPNTVHVHVRNIYRKLGVSSRKMLYRLLDEQPELVEDCSNGSEQRAAA